MTKPQDQVTAAIAKAADEHIAKLTNQLAELQRRHRLLLRATEYADGQRRNSVTTAEIRAILADEPMEIHRG